MFSSFDFLKFLLFISASLISAVRELIWLKFGTLNESLCNL